VLRRSINMLCNLEGVSWGTIHHGSCFRTPAQSSEGAELHNRFALITKRELLLNPPCEPCSGAAGFSEVCPSSDLISGFVQATARLIQAIFPARLVACSQATLNPTKP
jgi:hypothetical protein